MAHDEEGQALVLEGGGKGSVASSEQSGIQEEEEIPPEDSGGPRGIFGAAVVAQARAKGEEGLFRGMRGSGEVLQITGCLSGRHLASLPLLDTATHALLRDAKPWLDLSVAEDGGAGVACVPLDLVLCIFQSPYFRLKGLRMHCVDFAALCELPEELSGIQRLRDLETLSLSGSASDLSEDSDSTLQEKRRILDEEQDAHHSGFGLMRRPDDEAPKGSTGSPEGSATTSSGRSRQERFPGQKFFEMEQHRPSGSPPTGKDSGERAEGWTEDLLALEEPRQDHSTTATGRPLAVRKAFFLGGRKVEAEKVFARFTRLERLELQDCNELVDVSALVVGVGLAKAPLKVLDLSGCKALADVSSLAAASKKLPGRLRTLNLSHCPEVANVSVLASLKSLVSLNLSGCGVGDVSPLAGLTGLKTLNLHGCFAIADVSSLAKLGGQAASTSESLKSLKNDAAAVYRDSSISLAKSRDEAGGLRELDLSGCEQLVDVAPLTGLLFLETLRLRGCVGLKEISALANLKKLKTLDLACCWQLQDLVGLPESIGLAGSPPARLRSFDPRPKSCASSELLDGASAFNEEGLFCLSLGALEILDLSGCQSLVDFSALATLTGLKILSLVGCQHLTEVTALAGLVSLETLYLSRCVRLEDVSGLSNLPNLHTLHLNFCEALCDVSPLAGLTRLRRLNLARCRRLAGVPALASLFAGVVLTGVKASLNLHDHGCPLLER